MRKQSLLYFGKDIPLSENVFIKQPSLEKVIEIGEDAFSLYTLPFTLTLDTLFGDDFDTSNTSLFELFFEQSKGEYVLDKIFGSDTISHVTKSLSFFTGIDIADISVLQNRKKIALKDYILDKDNFEEIRDIIKAVCVKRDLEVEKPPKDMSKRKRDIWEKLQNGRKRKSQRESIKIEDMANFITYGGKSYVPTSELLKMTYYQFSNAYTAVISVDSYNVGMGYKLSQKYDVKEEIKHWTKALKIESSLD